MPDSRRPASTSASPARSSATASGYGSPVGRSAATAVAHCSGVSAPSARASSASSSRAQPWCSGTVGVSPAAVAAILASTSARPRSASGRPRLSASAAAPSTSSG